MLERDYIMRLIRQFFETLEKLREKRKRDKGATLQMDIKGMYRSYFQQTDNFFYEQDCEFILHYLQTEFPPQEFIQRVEMLAEMFYFDAEIQPASALTENLLKKSLTLMEFLDTHSNTYSLDRQYKIREIKKKIDQ